MGKRAERLAAFGLLFALVLGRVAVVVVVVVEMETEERKRDYERRMRSRRGIRESQTGSGRTRTRNGLTAQDETRGSRRPKPQQPRTHAHSAARRLGRCEVGAARVNARCTTALVRGRVGLAASFVRSLAHTTHGARVTAVRWLAPHAGYWDGTRLRQYERAAATHLGGTAAVPNRRDSSVNVG